MYDVNQQELVSELAKELKGKVQMPEWAVFVKTGVSKEKPPVNDDWWELRSASVLRQVELKGPIGVSKLRYKYGGKKNRGVKPEHFYKGSGKIIRTILQQLESAKLIEKGEVGTHKGRVTTSAGTSLIFAVAKKMGSTVKPVKKPLEKSQADSKDKKAEGKENSKEKSAKKPAAKKEADDKKSEKKAEDKKPDVKKEEKKTDDKDSEEEIKEKDKKEK